MQLYRSAATATGLALFATKTFGVCLVVAGLAGDDATDTYAERHSCWQHSQHDLGWLPVDRLRGYRGDGSLEQSTAKNTRADANSAGGSVHLRNAEVQPRKPLTPTWFSSTVSGLK